MRVKQAIKDNLHLFTQDDLACFSAVKEAAYQEYCSWWRFLMFIKEVQLHS